MINLFKQRQQPLQAGLSIGAGSLALTVVKRERNSSPELIEATHVALEGDETPAAAIESINRQFRLNKIPTVMVMEPGSYSLLQVEAPNVAPEEMKSALRWKVKDLIDFHIDDATIDLFDMPESARTGSIPMVSVVVARTGLIQQCVDFLHDNEIEPLAIDITELSLHNLTKTSLEAESAPVATMFVLPDNVFIEISDCEQMYLSRNIGSPHEYEEDAPLDFANDEWNRSRGQSANFDMLSLELQRSMDYYESQYGRGPASEMRLFQTVGEGDEFVDHAQRELPFRVNRASLTDSISGLDALDNDQLPHYLPALGAALRAA